MFDSINILNSSYQVTKSILILLNLFLQFSCFIRAFLEFFSTQHLDTHSVFLIR